MNETVFRVAGDAMPMACMVVAVAVLGFTAWQVDDALRASTAVHALQHRVVATIVAEEAAFAATRWIDERNSAAEREFCFESPTGMRAVVRPQGGGPVRITVAGGKDGRSYRFDCPMLRGEVRAPLGHALSLRHSVLATRGDLRAWVNENLDIGLVPMRDSVATRLSSEYLEPELCGTRAAAAPLASCLVEDPAVGLLRTRQGTDRRDYRFVEGAVLENEIVVVPGNLWFDRSAEPLVLDLESGSRTIVVHGNVYLGRDVAVRGTGRLLIVAVRGEGSGFRDLDLDGAYRKGEPVQPGSGPYRGPVEGTGAIYLGIPGCSVPVAIQASLIADGEVYVLADPSTVEGAVVVGEGITWPAAGRAGLRLPGNRLSNTKRARIPGFRREGGLRPGWLRPVE